MLERLQNQINDSSVLRWYQGREPNERPIIAGLAVLVAVAFFWAALWKPVVREHFKAERSQRLHRLRSFYG